MTTADLEQLRRLNEATAALLAAPDEAARAHAREQLRDLVEPRQQ